MRVLVTGAAGYFGRTILPALLADERVTEVVATDLRDPGLCHPKLRFAARDLLHAGVVDLLAEVDAAIHLAFVVERKPGEDPALLNVQAAQRFLQAAVERLEVVVVASSVMAYGLRLTPFDRLRETEAPGPGRGFYYAEQKLALEAFLAGLKPVGRVICARPTVVGGPHMPAFRAAPYRGRFLLMPRTRLPIRYQMLHEADLASAFASLLHAPAGLYNVGPDDVVTTHEAARLLGLQPIALPLWLCGAFLDVAWRLGASAIGGDWARTLRYPSHVIDNGKLRALGWAPRFTTRETLLATRGGTKG